MIEQLLPPGLLGAEMFDTGQDVSLHPDEAPHVTRAVEKRRREFALGRACARAALAQAGIADVVIGRGADGAPLWPHGMVGSITHTAGYACAVAAHRADFRAAGVDAERIGGVGDGLLSRLFDDQERARLLAMTPQDRSLHATLGFSAKEACFKAFGAQFRDVHIAWSDDSFCATSAQGSGEGRFAVAHGLALTLIAVPA